MTLKQRALLDVVKMLAAITVTGVAIGIVAVYIGQLITMIIVGLASFGYLAKLAYDMRVSQLKFEADRVERALKDGR